VSQLGNISGRDAARAFQKAGWRVAGQVGSHLVLTKEASARISQSRCTRNSRPARLRALIRAAGMTVDEFMDLL